MIFSKLFRKNRAKPAITYDLTRFTEAQERIYAQAIQELKEGYKYHHWMWFIFPQYDGLAYSNRSKFYAIKSKEEAKAYLAHPLLGQRLKECCQALLEIENKSIHSILGSPDNLKLKSSMTLFWHVSDDDLFKAILDKYFNGKEDEKTIKLLNIGLL